METKIVYGFLMLFSGFLVTLPSVVLGSAILNKLGFLVSIRKNNIVLNYIISLIFNVVTCLFLYLLVYSFYLVGNFLGS